MRAPRCARGAGLLFAVALAAGCGQASLAGEHTPPARLERLGGSSVPSVVLTAQGAQRIGIRTAPVMAAPAGRHPARRRRATVVIPYSAVLYELDGTPVVYINPSAYVYTRVPIVIDRIAGDSVYLSRGPPVGTPVVTVGGEELLGVQDGVEAER